MSTDTPIPGDWWCPSCKVGLEGTRVTYDERCDTCGTPVSVAGEGDIARLERENARLREEVETLNVRHAAAMLHAQTHADEYNALREDEKGLLQDIQRLTEEAFKRDEELALTTGTLESRERNIATLQEELAEAKREHEFDNAAWARDNERLKQAEARSLEYKTEHAALLGTSQWQETEIADLRDDVKRLMQIASECEERALANEKDAGRYRWLRDKSVPPHNFYLSVPVEFADEKYTQAQVDAAIDAAIAGAKHD